MVSLISIFAFAAVAYLGISHPPLEECTDDVDMQPSKGSAMLQMRRQAVTPAKEVRCDVNRAKEQPLTEEGFAAVSSSCCYEDIKAFTRRLIDNLGYDVCDEGGLSGISPFYACPPFPVSLANLTQELNDAVQTKNSKCHWLVDKADECVPVSIECQVAFYFPLPAPKPVAKGFIAFRATNPAEMVRSNRIIDLITEELALATGVESKYINVVIATGTVDGEASESLLLIPRSQAFFISSGAKSDKSASCKVFALYSFQDKAPPAPEVLSESAVVNAMKGLDTTLTATRITQDLQSVDANVGVVEIAETSVCEKTSGKCNRNAVSAIQFR